MNGGSGFWFALGESSRSESVLSADSLSPPRFQTGRSAFSLNTGFGVSFALVPGLSLTAKSERARSLAVGVIISFLGLATEKSASGSALSRAQS